MHRALLSFAQTLLIEPRCPICDGPWDSPLPPTAPCTTCLDALALPGQGLKGLLPLPWCALGPYAGQLRQLLLKLRQPRQGKALAALVQLLTDRFTLLATAVQVANSKLKAATILAQWVQCALTAGFHLVRLSQ